MPSGASRCPPRRVAFDRMASSASITNASPALLRGAHESSASSDPSSEIAYETPSRYSRPGIGSSRESPRYRIRKSPVGGFEGNDPRVPASSELGVCHCPLPTPARAGTTATPSAMKVAKPKGCRHPIRPPRTSSSKADTAPAAAIASPTATGTSSIPDSGSADPASEASASPPNGSTSAAARAIHVRRQPLARRIPTRNGTSRASDSGASGTRPISKRAIRARPSEPTCSPLPISSPQPPRSMKRMLHGTCNTNAATPAMAAVPRPASDASVPRTTSVATARTAAETSTIRGNEGTNAATTASSRVRAAARRTCRPMPTTATASVISTPSSSSTLDAA
ncbi:unannotated protein [freshwater metagenome]|uniref:Unannotated protein n=1 Tax=freshwater metagenome TaxID=449393 RepID=A0A6J7UQJ9_9ZZZZ